MRCPITSEQWQEYRETGDIRVAQHLATCAVCCAEANRYAHLETALAHLSTLPAPNQIRVMMTNLQQEVVGQSLTCTDVLEVLEAWREGDLSPTRTFLVEDHLLTCEPCQLALEQADVVANVLHSLPAFEAPAAVAERLAAGRRPWWERFFPKPVINWQVGWAATCVAIAIAVATQLAPLRPVPIANNHQQDPTTVISSNRNPENPIDTNGKYQTIKPDNKPNGTKNSTTPKPPVNSNDMTEGKKPPKPPYYPPIDKPKPEEKVPEAIPVPPTPTIVAVILPTAEEALYAMMWADTQAKAQEAASTVDDFSFANQRGL